MADKPNLIVTILQKHALREPLTAEEQQVFVLWRQESPENRALAERLANPYWVAEIRRLLEKTPTEKIWARIRLLVYDRDPEPIVSAVTGSRPSVIRSIMRWRRFFRRIPQS